MKSRSKGALELVSLLLAVAAWPATAIAVAEGQWTRPPIPQSLRCRTVVRDELRNRLIAFGGGSFNYNTNDVFELSLSGPPEWQRLEPTGTPPTARNGQAAVYDPVRDRLLVFGGDTRGGTVGDVWELTLSGTPNWNQLSPTGGPSPRWGHVAVYDPVRDRVVVFGGSTGGAAAVALNDVWELPLATFPLAWSAITPAGSPPLPRYGSVGIYDPIDDRMIVFGGANITSSHYNDVWSLPLGGTPVWTPLAPTGTPPAPREVHAAAYDPTRKQMVVFGGRRGNIALNDVWALTLGASPAWAAVAATGTLPSPRYGVGWINDPALDRMVLFGGLAAEGHKNDLWSLSLSGTPQWQTMIAQSVGVPGRYEHCAVFDPVSRNMFVIDGFNGSFLDDLWAIPVDDPKLQISIVPLGPAPAARHSFSATLDGARRRIIVIGGISSDGLRHNDVWALSLDPPMRWTQLLPGGTPPSPICKHVAILDPIRNRIIVMGGSTTVENFTNRVWVLSLLGDGAWSELAPAGAPPDPRFGHAGIYDPIRDRLVISGGEKVLGATLGSVYALRLSGAPRWSQLLTGPVLSSHTAVYDAGNDRMLLFGGIGTAQAKNDTWAFPLGPSGAVTQLTPSGTLPEVRGDHSAIYDAAGAQMVVFGGFNANPVDTDVWSLKLSSSTTSSPPPTTRGGVQLAAAVPDPAIGEVTLGFALAADGDAVLNVYDLSGRLVRSLVDASLPAGPHSVRWDRRDSAGSRVPAGLYFYELRAGAIRMARRVVLVH